MTINQKHSTELQAAILEAIVAKSLTESNGVRVAHIHTPDVLDACCMVMASLIATAPEAQGTDGLKRVLRRLARQLETRVSEFKAHTAKHGFPFKVEA